MYKVQVIEHFEDWFVSDLDGEEFADIHDAIEAFISERALILSGATTPMGIDGFCLAF